MDDEMFALEADERSVRFWSRRRLPFEPTEPMLDARAALRSAIRRLSPVPGQALTASYTSLDASFCDAENILFYNVGASAFGELAATAIRFEREHSSPAATSSGRPFPHRQTYRVGPVVPARSEQPICSMEFPLPRLSGDLKPHAVWWEASRSVVTRSGESTGAFEVRVDIELPRRVANLTAVLKPLLDGLISALHSDRKRSPEAISRLSAKMGWLPEEIVARLESPGAAFLGPRDLLQVYRGFVKWNPADELCEVGTVTQRIGSASRAQVRIWNVRPL